jgi:uncharacterized protein YjiS (DUF1127 family)
MPSHSHAAPAAYLSWSEELRAAFHALARITSQAWRNAVTRSELAQLDDRMLADIGLTREAALLEADRFPWEMGPWRHQPRREAQQSVLRHLDAMWRRHRSRQRIARLDASLLKDIGVSYAEAEAEANKPFWRG